MCGSDEASPTIIRVKKIPMESTWAEFWNVVFMPDPAPRCSGGRLFMTPARLGEPKDAMREPGQEQDDREDPVGKSIGQDLEQREADGGPDHAAGGEGPCAVAVGEDPRDRAGDEHAERERDHGDAGPQRGRGEASSRGAAARSPAAR